MKNQLHFDAESLADGQSVVKLAGALQTASDSAKGKLTREWTENLQHLAGYLTGAKRDAALLLGTADRVESYPFGRRQPEGSTTQIDVLFPAISRLLGRLLGGVSRFQCVAATADERDKDAASALEKLLLAYWYNEDMMQIVGRAIIQSLACSHAYVLVEGDPTVGDPVPLPVETDEGPGVQMMPQGEVILKVHLATQVSVFPGIRKLSDSPAVLLVEHVTEPEFVRRWGPLPEKAVAANYEERLNELDGAIDQSLYEVKRLFIKPDRSMGFPLGASYVIVGDEVQYEYKYGKESWIGVGDPETKRDLEYPLVDFADLPFCVGYWSRGRQQRARPQLKILNIAWSKASQVAALPGVIIGVPIGSDINREQITNAPIAIIKFNPAVGKGIEFWTPPRMPFYEYVIQMAEKWVDQVFSQSDISRGIAPGSRFPFKEAELLVQEQQVVETPYGRAIMDAISRVARKVASEGVRVWPEQKVALILGNNRRYERVSFRKANLSAGWDVRIVPDVPLPEGRAARWSSLSDAMRSGMFTDIGPAKAREMLGLYSEDDLLRPSLAQEANIKEEETEIEDGRVPPRRWFDDDRCHTLKHMQRAVERSNLSTPGEDAARQKHVAEHMQAIQEAEERQAAAQQTQQAQQDAAKTAEAPAAEAANG